MTIKKSDEYSQAKDGTTVESMVEHLKAIPREKKPATVTQCASMQAIIDRDPKDDEKHFNRPMVLNWKAVPEAKSVDEAVNKRDYDATQVAIQEDIRRKGRNSLGDAVSMGASSISPETKERAVEAFNYSKPTKLTPAQEAKAVELNRIQHYGEKDHEEEVKLSMWARFLACFGVKSVPRRSYSYVEVQQIKAGTLDPLAAEEETK